MIDLAPAFHRGPLTERSGHSNDRATAEVNGS